MNRGDELFMRLLYLKRRTCDQLSRDLTTHALHVLHNCTWEDYFKDPNMTNDARNELIQKYFPKFNCIPNLDQCDTTTLFKFVINKVSKVGSNKDTTFEPLFKTIKDMRNDAAHQTNKQLTDSEYDSQFDEMYDTFKDLDQQLFKNLNGCLEFLVVNKHQSLETFCKNNPNEVFLFLRTLEDNLKYIVNLIEPLKTIADSHEKLTDITQKLVDNNETLVDANKSLADQLLVRRSCEPLKLKPVSNIPETTALAGREEDLKKMKSLLENVQLVLICGPPGIGKTSLALKYAKESEIEESQQLFQFKDCVYLNIELKDFEFTDKDVFHEIGKAIGEFFPAIVSLDEYKDEPFSRFMEHARELLNEMRLFFILDNIDNVLKANDGNSILDRVVRKLSSLGPDVKMLATARDKAFNPDYLPFEVVDLNPISVDDAYNFLIGESRNLSHINDEIMQAMAKYSGGIPLILKIVYSYVKRRPDFKIEDLPKIESTSDWKRLEKSLDLSFKDLNPFQIEILQCASLFMGDFDKETLLHVYQNIASDNFCEDALGSCYDLSLVEFNESSLKYHVHPYIKWHIRKFTFETEDRKSVIEANFVASYVKKLMALAEKQLEKNKFLKTLQECVSDAKNIEKALRLINSTDKWHISAFRALIDQLTGFACFWLLTSFWMLNKIGRFKPYLISAVGELEKIFTQIDKIDYVVLCKCFIAHQLRLKTKLGNVNKARLKIDEAFLRAESLSGPMAAYCKGYVKFSMGRFQQHIETNLAKYNYKRRFQWESNSANEHYEAAVEYYFQWRPEKSDISAAKFDLVFMVESLHIVMFQKSHMLRKATEETEKLELFKHFADVLLKTSTSLGTHEEVAYAHKKYGDLLFQFGSKDQALETYEYVFDYYGLFGPEIRTQQIEILINWSDCYDDDAKALEKLKMADEILKEYYLKDHKWARDVQSRINKRRRNLEQSVISPSKKDVFVR